MRKKLKAIMILLTAAMAITIAAPKTTGYAATHENEDDWEIFDASNPLGSEDGKYYLEEDVTLNDNITVSGIKTLCLNGHKLTMNEKYIKINEDAKLTITDCKGGGEIIETKAIYLFNIEGFGSLTIESGSLINNKDQKLINCKSNSDLYIGGGALKSKSKDITNTVEEYAGQICANGAIVKILGGSFIVENATRESCYINERSSNVYLHGTTSFAAMADGAADIKYSAGEISVNGNTKFNRLLSLKTMSKDNEDTLLYLGSSAGPDRRTLFCSADEGYVIDFASEHYYISKTSIESYPSKEKMEVIATPNSGLQYQWYLGKKVVRQITASDVNPVFAMINGIECDDDGVFSKGENEFPFGEDLRTYISEHYDYFEYVNKYPEAILTVEVLDEVSPDFDIYVSNKVGGDDSTFHGEVISSLRGKNPQLSKTGKNTYSCEMPIGICYFGTTEKVRLKAYVSYIDKETPIEGETSNVLKKVIPGLLGCEVTWRNGDVAPWSSITNFVEFAGATVRFDSQGGTAINESTVLADTYVEEPVAPKKAGYKFGGWFTDKECTKAFDFKATKVTKDITLYAKWTILFSITEEEIEANTLVLEKKISAKPSASGTVKLTWGAVKNADEYDILAANYGSKLSIAATINQPAGRKEGDKLSTTIKKIGKSKISTKKNYKFTIVAYKIVEGKRVEIGRSYSFVVAGSKSTYTNIGKIKIVTSTINLKKKGSKVIKYTLSKENPKKKKYLPKKFGSQVRFVSSDKKIAKVNASGKVTAVGKGECKIYVITLNGLMKEVKVKVKK